MYYTYTKSPIGCFTEKDHGQYFEYSMNKDTDDYSMCMVENYPHKVWVGRTDDEGWRYAIVKKTVAYVVTDEDDYGMPVVEKWMLKKNNVYLA